MRVVNAVLFAAPMGHNVDMVSRIFAEWLSESGLFEPLIVGKCKSAKMSIHEFMAQHDLVKSTDLFIFICPSDAFDDPNDRKLLEETIAAGTPVMFTHGLHPTFRDWEEAEKMIGLLWRQTASHGDYNTHRVTIEPVDHPITRDVRDFDTSDELFCALENVWGVPMTVLASAYSDASRISRWGHPGTGNNEPVLTIGEYGKVRTLNFILGHIWTHYTGHGLLENTSLSLKPKEVRILFLRSCEWLVTGDCEAISKACR
jgi:hypothetical protein